MSGSISEKSVPPRMISQQKPEPDGKFRQVSRFLLISGILLLAGCSTYSGSPWGRSSVSTGSSSPWGQSSYSSGSSGDIFTNGHETGIASWYGPTFYGKKTASGAIFRKDALTAAHRTLPLGTRVRVENLDNGRSVDVIVNDRGPFVNGRIIDLSWKAANAIGMLGKGTAPVRLTVLSGVNYPSQPEILAEGTFEVQVGSFSSYDEAKAYLTKMKRYPDAHIVKAVYPGGTVYRVRVGKFSSISNAREYAQTLRNDLGEAFVVRQ